MGPPLQSCPGWHTAPQWLVHMHTTQCRMTLHRWLDSFWPKVCKTQLKTPFSWFFSHLQSRHFLTKCQMPASVSGKRETCWLLGLWHRVGKTKQCNKSRTCAINSVSPRLPRHWGMSAVTGMACRNGLIWPSPCVTAEGPANEK